MNYSTMMEKINSLCEDYNCIAVNYIGESIFGRGIPLLSLGCGKKRVMYLGVQSARDLGLCDVLLRFIKEYSAAYVGKGSFYGLPLDYLYKKVTISVVPMLNPDGVEYRLSGVSADNPLRDRVLKMNGLSDDFSQWCANARGVDLRWNYNCGYAQYKKSLNGTEFDGGAPFGYCGEYSESEQETGSLCNHIRYSEDICAVIDFCNSEDKITYAKSVKNDKKALALSEMLNYKLNPVDIADASIYFWCEDELSLPCFSVGCDTDKKGRDDFVIYTELRKLLFCAPMLF